MRQLFVVSNKKKEETPVHIHIMLWTAPNNAGYFMANIFWMHEMNGSNSLRHHL